MDLEHLSNHELADQLKERADTVEVMGDDQRWRAHLARTVPLLREAARRFSQRGTSSGVIWKKTPAGTTIEEAVFGLIDLANQSGETFVTEFNDVAVTVRPEGNPQTIIEQYRTDREDLHQRYLKSPEGQQWLRERYGSAQS